jgi:epoxyqueuosine reductase QueG
MNGTLTKELLRSGATVVGIAWVKDALHREIAHLERAVSIGVDRNLNEDTVRLLLGLQKRAVRILRKHGYRYLCIPPDSDRIRNTFVSKLYPLFTHKMAATSAGLGWIGKNGLLISPVFGPRLSLATILTDAPLQAGTPIEQSLCGDCGLCMEFCPSEAITGEEWSRREPFNELIQLDRCASHKRKIRTLHGKPNCGLCITICPYGRKKTYKNDQEKACVHAE